MAHCEKHNLWRLVNHNIKQIGEYAKLTKKQLLRVIIIYQTHLQTSRNKIIELGLEINYLNRKLKMGGKNDK